MSRFIADKYRTGANAPEALSAVLDGDNYYLGEILARLTSKQLAMLAIACRVLASRCDQLRSGL